MAHEDDVLSQAPLFEALGENDARALRADVTNVHIGAGGPAVRRGRRRRQALHHPERQDQADQGRPRRAGEPAQRARPRRDVRRAVAVRPEPAHRQRHRGHRRHAGRAGPRRPAGLADRPARGRHAHAAERWPSGCAGSTTSRPTWSSPTCRAGWPRRCWTWRSRFGVQQENGLQVNHDLTQEELAQLVGASRETVNKALADFAARGWIQLAAKSVLLIDPDRLRKRAS